MANPYYHDLGLSKTPSARYGVDRLGRFAARDCRRGLSAVRIGYSAR